MNDCHVRVYSGTSLVLLGRRVAYEVSDERDHRLGDRVRVLLISGGTDGHEHTVGHRAAEEGQDQSDRLVGHGASDL